MRFRASLTSLSVLAALGIASGTILAAPARATGTTSLTVNAKISGTCKVTTAPGTLDFGTIDPSGTANATATATFVMKCSTGVTSTAATDDNGANFAAGNKRMQHTVAGNYLPYSIAYSSDAGFTGAGFASAAASRIITITGTVTPTQYANAMATTGTQIYTDTVTVTVNP